MLRIVLPFAAVGLLRRPIAATDVGVSIRVLYVLIVVVDVNLAVSPSAVITPPATPRSSKDNTGPEK